ncbi:hypothetical protein SAMN05443270_3140 [Lacrimispora sphenoides]|uniref:hypothetical protein n=1 Tax=Lacrimispora sphenoides TaxID=29370 RepID=UPI0008C857A0|nr:hypothetical protein [Lacrimispora sphenoides]SEU09935.1 hypothetical protein SAMN05443270_3140 [Lacrimispora sphenoides]
MRFYYENNMGDSGFFTLKKSEIVKAIQSAWNIEANLYMVPSGTNNKNLLNQFIHGNIKPILLPDEDNEVINDYLEEFGLYLIDGDEYRELRYIKSGELAIDPNDYSDILRLN